MQITLNKETLLRALPFLGVTALFLLFLINDPSWFWVELWFLIEIILLTSLTRTISLKQGALALLMGIFLGFGASFIIGSLFELIGVDGALRSFTMPVIEEVAKVLPILVLLKSVGGIKRPRLNLSDFAFLGACSGAGFSMLEKYFWDYISFPFTYGPHIGDLYFFSDALGVYAGGGEFGYIGHAAATVFVALGLGLGYQLLRKKKAFWFVAAFVPFAWVSLEHIILNYYYTPNGSAITLFGGGMWTPWILLLCLLGAITFDLFSLRQVLVKIPKLAKHLKTALSNIKDLASLLHACKAVRGANYLAWVKQK